MLRCRRIDEQLQPLRQTANVTGVHCGTPMVSHDMTYTPDAYDRKDAAGIIAS